MIAGLLMLGGGAAAGLFGSLLGLGGGVLIVPLLTLGFGRPLREAVAVSLVCVIVTSSAAAGAYLRGRVANLRLGAVLALFTASGALVGALLAFVIPERMLAGLFALLLAYVAVTMGRAGLKATRPAPGAVAPVPVDPPATPAADGGVQVVAGQSDSRPDPAPSDAEPVGRLDGPGYRVRRVAPASVASLGAGIIAALLGVGGGVINVPTMNLLMGVPLRVATATSNLMIGVTAVASAIIYVFRGGLDPYIAAPTALGVFVGASVGARVAHRIDVRILRLLFVVVLGYTSLQMAMRALGG
ncbi:MAG TPA: sulfite exporter TauE/SafE family protein [Candidatus Limnocylindrales bacterium]|nr:sulfite exporter TauE/SafE family protein [Candidatus Limnocylindrales bacterium]